MINIGQFNPLKVIKSVPFGVYLDGGTWRDILLPTKVVPPGTQENDIVNVFIYFDSNDRMIATTLQPKVCVGECAYLKVVDVNRVGAFLDWGLNKDLLVPGPEQLRPLEKDKSYLVYVKLDNQERIIASTKLDYYLDKSQADYKPGNEVSVLIAETTELGTKVVINSRHWGLIHKSDIFQTLRYGQKIRAYIKTVREDGKIDVALRKPGQECILELADRILLALEKANGFLPLHDKSPPEAISRAFGDSKKSFKSAIGQLYKQGKIIIDADGIRLPLL